jgi:hypothetical protein
VTLCRRLAIHASEDDGVAAALLLAVASVRDRLSEAEVAAVDQLATEPVNVNETPAFCI